MDIELSKYKTFKWLILLLLLCCSCAGPTPLSSTDYLSLLECIKNLLSFCILILGSDSSFWKQIIPRYYYALYHLARLVYNNNKRDDSDNHTTTWKAMPTDISTDGLQFKAQRIINDYYAFAVSDTDVSKQLSMIENSNLLSKLSKEVQNTINGYHDASPSFNKSIFEHSVNELLSDIELKNSELQGKIQAVMAKQTQSANTL